MVVGEGEKKKKRINGGGDWIGRGFGGEQEHSANSEPEKGEAPRFRAWWDGEIGCQAKCGQVTLGAATK